MTCVQTSPRKGLPRCTECRTPFGPSKDRGSLTHETRVCTATPARQVTGADFPHGKSKVRERTKIKRSESGWRWGCRVSAWKTRDSGVRFRS